MAWLHHLAAASALALCCGDQGEPTPTPPPAALGCDAGKVSCDNSCVDLATSMSHCGACNAACNSDGRCIDGDCVYRPVCHGTTCEFGDMCDYPNDTCGAHLMEVEDFPLCATMPTSCGSELAPVCGCDDVTYDNLCLAHAAGVDLNRQNTCEPPSPDWFKCGPIFCRRDQEYCSELLDDAGGGLWQCKPVPQCSASDSMCACLMALGCRDVFHECNDDGAGGVRFSCWWI